MDVPSGIMIRGTPGRCFLEFSGVPFPLPLLLESLTTWCVEPEACGCVESQLSAVLSAHEYEFESDVVLILSMVVLGILLLLPGGISCDEKELGGVLLLLPDAFMITTLLSGSLSLRLSLERLRDFWPSLGRDPPKHKADLSTLDTSSSDAGGEAFEFLMGDFCQTLRGIDVLLMSSELKKGEDGGESLVELPGDVIAGTILLFRCCRLTKGSSR